MEKVQWDSINKKQNGLKQSNIEKIIIISFDFWKNQKLSPIEFRKFVSNMTNVGLTTNGRLASVDLSLQSVNTSKLPYSVCCRWLAVKQGRQNFKGSARSDRNKEGKLKDRREKTCQCQFIKLFFGKLVSHFVRSL